MISSTLEARPAMTPWRLRLQLQLLVGSALAGTNQIGLVARAAKLGVNTEEVAGGLQDPSVGQRLLHTEAELEGEFLGAPLALLKTVEFQQGQSLAEEEFWLDSRRHKEASAPHPFWELEGWRVTRPECLTCFVMLCLAGLLCSAGGIGGGGIYVTVLMIAGQLSVHDAVPLSKSIVFLGSVSSLVLNLKKSFGGAKAQTSLIDYNVVRLVVPSSLIGTYLGVVLNSTLGSFVILALLTSILIAITIMVGRQAYTQYGLEQGLASASPHVPARSNPDPPAANAEHAEEGGPLAANQENVLQAAQTSLKSTMTRQDLMMAFPALFIVIAGGVLQYHARSCLQDLQGPDLVHKACHHQIFFFLESHGGLEAIMGNVGETVLMFSVLVPLVACSLVASYYTWTCTTKENWNMRDALAFEMMAVVTGCLAGLVGIGGGLIFSPFFLIMGVEPAIAVATSSTCVIFTSSSTTMQYLFTDRIIMSLTLVYGLANLGASYLGTKFVHFLQDHFSTRRSYIMAIVGTGVAISALLSTMKLFRTEMTS